jgi:hypothetical protein
MHCVLFTLKELLLELGLCDFDLDGLVDLLCVSALVVGVVLNGGGKECVDEGRLSESRLASNLQIISVYRIAYMYPQRHTMMVKAAPLFATILCRWLGKFAIPIGDALSAVGGAIMNMYAADSTDLFETQL